MNLNDLPYEMLFDILLNADPKDIASYCQTSKRASEICKDQGFWRAKLWTDYGKQEQIKGMTWMERYQIGPIKVINSPIAAGNGYLGIIDDRGDLYITGLSRAVGGGFSKRLTRVELESKVISVITGYGHDNSFPFIGAVTVDGEVYVLDSGRSILAPPKKPHKLNFSVSGKIVKIVRENGYMTYGIIMDNGFAYLLKQYDLPGLGRNIPILVLPESGRKVVDLIIPNTGQFDEFMCYFLDNHGNVFYFRLSDNESKKIKII